MPRYRIYNIIKIKFKILLSNRIFCEYCVVTLRIHQKRVISLLFRIHCLLPKAHSYTMRFRCCQKLEISLYFFWPKTLNTIQKRTVTEKTPHFAARFSCGSVQLCCALSANIGKDKKFQISWRFCKGFSKMLAILCLVSISY
jgi:hypothetical protein